MPLPHLEPNNTARVFIDYTSYNVSHTFMFRLGAGATPQNGTDMADTVANTLKQRMSTHDSFTAARFSAKNSLFTLPISFTPVFGVIDPANDTVMWKEDPESAFISFCGRGMSTSRRVRWEFFTAIKTPTWPLTNRYNAGAEVVIDALRTNWTNIVENGGSTGEQIVTVGGDIPVIYGYVNIAKNSYWQRKQR